MNVVDSSGWIEYFSNGKNADFFAPAILDTNNLIVPVICIYEVFKRIAILEGEESALIAVGIMAQGQEVGLDRVLAVQAAQLSMDHRLAMADSILLATARLYSAVFWTQDEHFKDIEDIRYIAKN